MPLRRRDAITLQASFSNMRPILTRLPIIPMIRPFVKTSDHDCVLVAIITLSSGLRWQAVLMASTNHSDYQLGLLRGAHCSRAFYSAITPVCVLYSICIHQACRRYCPS